jgi:hypothetical protein
MGDASTSCTHGADTTTDTSGHGSHLSDSSDRSLRLFRFVPIHTATATIRSVRSRLTTHIPLRPLCSTYSSPSPSDVTSLSTCTVQQRIDQPYYEYNSNRLCSLAQVRSDVSPCSLVTIAHVRIRTPFVSLLVPDILPSFPLSMYKLTTCFRPDRT